MQIVSGAMGKEKVHYEAVKPKFVKAEMKKFLTWFNSHNTLDLVLKAAIAHFWFIIIHPFDDGNGRIGRAITDMLLAQAEGSGEKEEHAEQDNKENQRSSGSFCPEAWHDLPMQL
jgi:Fic family protein